LGLIDPDTVDLSNIQRQVLYGTPDIGRPKVEIARERLLRLNPHVEIVTHRQRLTRENARAIIGNHAIIADASDNFATRYLVNDACVLEGKPNVQASIFRFEGQLSVFDATRGPCYRCIFPAPPPPGQVPSCAEAGVLGVLPGIVGSLQAVEILKLILGKGEPLIGRMALIDTLSFCFRDIKVSKDPRCPICGESPTIRELIDYEAFCGGRSQEAAAAAEQVPSIEVERLQARLAAGDSIRLLDVREPHEAETARITPERARIEEDLLIPLGRLPDCLDDLDRSREYVVYCHIGIRSVHAVQLMREAGFRHVYNLTGGIDAWSARIDPSVPRY
jgi:adenylyltransferase/sulfurtransferase